LLAAGRSAGAAGEVAVIDVVLLTVKVAAVAPKETPVAPLKFVPVTVSVNPGPPAVAVARLPEDAQGFARELYAALRDLEDADCSAILVEQVPAGAEWDAVRDRLTRAASS